MAEVSVRLPDGSEKQVAEGATYGDVAKAIGSGLAKAALAAKENGSLVDLSKPVTPGVEVAIVTNKDDAGLELIRHSTAHILAMAVQKLWPGTQVTIGPVIDHGFYYDFAFPKHVSISEADLPKIEDEMRAIIKADHKVSRQVIERAAAAEKFRGVGEHFKVEIVEDLPPDEEVSVYEMGGWFDLCRGPHIPSTKKAGAFKLTSVAGAYWRGDETKEQLTRIYGTAWANKQDLADHLHRLEEAKKRDHRLLGKQLDLFSFHLEAPANPFFHAKGSKLYTALQSYMRLSNTRFGFKEVGTPLVMNVELWHKSGHYDNYRENMYFTQVDDNEAAVKPMNCPGHCLIYKSTRHSYRDLPIRMSEFGRVHRHERSGVTHGLFRVRSFVQDDAHVFCQPDQISDEIGAILRQIDEAYGDLGFENFRMELSTRPDKSIGSDEMWNKAESALKEVLDNSGRNYQLNPGDGAFYGPKIDFHLIDSLGRSWQCGTVQLDFSMPERFGLEYQSSADAAETPVMIHRAVLGSLERFMGIYIEHYGGHFPLWSAPVQARLVNVSEKQLSYTRKVEENLTAAGLRVEADLRNEKLGYKIREAQLQKVPYMIVIGDKEVEGGTLSPRFRDGTQHDPMPWEKFVDLVKGDCGNLWGIA